MNRKSSLSILVLVALALSAHAREKEAPVKIRAMLHDPARPVAELFYTDKAGAVVPLNFRPQDLTETLLMQPVNGSLVLYDKAAIDPGNPEESLAASVQLPPDLQQAIMLVLPAKDGAKTAYRMLLIDDSPKAFPGGESKVLSLIKAEVTIQAGEHKIQVQPDNFARVPIVTMVNDFNMAQTIFYYKQDGALTAFAERQLQYLNVSRRLFIIHDTPGTLQPTVTTIVDAIRRE